MRTALVDVEVIVDGPNLLGAQNLLDSWIDLRQLKDFLDSIFHVLEVRWYDKLTTRREAFLNLLRSSGYTVMANGYLDVDAGIVQDIMSGPKQGTQNLVLFSGDEHYARALTEAMTSGRRVTLISAKASLWRGYEKMPGLHVFLLDSLMHNFDDSTRPKPSVSRLPKPSS